MPQPPREQPACAVRERGEVFPPPLSLIRHQEDANMKRSRWIPAAALSLAALVTIPALAQPPARGDGIFGSGRTGGPGGRGGAAAILRTLNLTEEQRQQIAALDQRRPDG